MSLIRLAKRVDEDGSEYNDETYYVLVPKEEYEGTVTEWTAHEVSEHELERLDTAIMTEVVSDDQ